MAQQRLLESLNITYLLILSVAAAGTAPEEEGNGQERPWGSTLMWRLSNLSGVLELKAFTLSLIGGYASAYMDLVLD
jgi:hypothetical protein